MALIQVGWSEDMEKKESEKMKYLILILLASCVSQQPKTKMYRYITTKQCPVGTVLYSDDVCRPIQQEEPAKVDHYMDMKDVDAYLQWKRRPKVAKVDCKQVFKVVNQCVRGN